MEYNADCSFRHAEVLSHLARAFSVNRNGHHNVALPAREMSDGRLSIETAGNRYGNLGNKKLTELVDWKVFTLFRAPKMVDKLVVSDRADPGQERLAIDPCMPLQVHGEQCFLHDILDILSRKAIAKEGVPGEPAQPWADLAKQLAIRIRVATVGGTHERCKVRLLKRHLLIPYSVDVIWTLQLSRRITYHAQ